MNRTIGLPGLRKLRRDANMTQEQLAERVGVRRETISGVEVGLVDASLRLARSIADVLGCEPCDLIRQDPAQPPLVEGDGEGEEQPRAQCP